MITLTPGGRRSAWGFARLASLVSRALTKIGAASWKPYGSPSRLNCTRKHHPKRPPQARPSGRSPQTSRIRRHLRAHGKEGVNGSSPLEGFTRRAGKTTGST